MQNLIIGGQGFIGKRLSKFLKDKGETVVNFDIQDNHTNDARSFKFDLTNIDRVFFLAWNVGGDKFLSDDKLQLEQLAWNLELLQNIMPQLEKSKKSFVFISSQFAENCDNVYGVTKRLGEVWTKLLNGVAIRLSNIYGPIEKESLRSRVVSDFISQAVDTGEIKMLTTGEEERLFIHIDDVCQGIYKAIQNNIPGLYDISGKEWIKIIDLAKLIAKLTKAKVSIGEKISFTPNSSQKSKVFGFSPKINLEEGLRNMINEYMNLTTN